MLIYRTAHHSEAMTYTASPSTNVSDVQIWWILAEVCLPTHDVRGMRRMDQENDDFDTHPTYSGVRSCQSLFMRIFGYY